MDILDKFTSHLKNTLAKAYSLAVELGSPGILPEHMLLSLAMQKGSIGGELLRKSSVFPEELRRSIKLAADITANVAPSGSDAHVPALSAEAKRVIEKAVLTANVHEHKYVGTEHLLASLLQVESGAIDAALLDQHVDMNDLRDHVGVILKSTSKFPEITETFEVGKAPKAKEDAKTKELRAEKKAIKAKAKTPALDFFAVELTNPKFQEHVDPVIGRDREVERLIQILCRRTKNNPVLLGEPGVGKTAIIEGLAKKIVGGEVPDVLADKRIFSLDLGLMLAGTIYRGEFEGRIKQIVDEVKANPDVILFIDELHNIMGAGSTSGSLDAANLLKPALARGELHCIGATTLAEFKKHIEGDSALERRFQSIVVNPPTEAQAVSIIKGLRENYEQYHGVKITDEAIEAAVSLSERYITDRFLPDKAIDLVDEAASCVKVAATTDEGSKQRKSLEDDLEKAQKRKQRAVMNENFIEALELKAKEKELTQALAEAKKKEGAKVKPAVGSIGRRDVAAVVARATGIPLTELMMAEKDRLLKLEDHLRRRIIGQDQAVEAVAEMVRRAKAGIANPERPLASFLFLGPSGVGKTELAKTLAEQVFQDPDALIRIDMSEFAEGFSTSKLVGAPAGYVGYKESTKLTDVIKRKPHSLVLFDEIEKAHGDVHNILLQILEDGHITDATGRKINFKNCIIVMTSNVGAASMLREDIGFGDGAKKDDITESRVKDAEAAAMSALEEAFRPEFINRIDKVVVFQPLSKAHLESIVGLQLADLSKRLTKDYGVSLAVKPSVAALIAEKSWNPLYGARGVRRQIQDLIENRLAESLLADAFSAGDVVAVKEEDGAVTVAKSRSNAKAKAKHGA
jgi:ATP-dependent Clp protease ATP-binding subunit ClpC